MRPDADSNYKSAVELIGNVEQTLARLMWKINPIMAGKNLQILTEISMERGVFGERAGLLNGTPIHPMRLVHQLQGIMSDDMILISGDSGFMFSSMELETAVRLNCNLVHLVCMDGHYDMVRFQQMAKYGRDAAVEFGPVDVAGIAKACGAHGLMIERPDEIAPTLKRALNMLGPVVIGVPVDYSDNHKLMEIMHPESFN